MTFKNKICLTCFDSYAPNAGNQKWCKTCAPNWSSLHRCKRYGISKPMFDAMYFDQDGTCLICNENEATDLDHNHATNEVRGLLCNRCNQHLHTVDTYGIDIVAQYLKGELV